MNLPFFASVPVPSVVVFAALWPTSLAFFVQLLVGRHVDDGRSFSGGQVLWRTVAAGVLASVGAFVLPLPATVATAVSGSTGVGASFPSSSWRSSPWSRWPRWSPSGAGCGAGRPPGITAG